MNNHNLLSMTAIRYAIALIFALVLAFFFNNCSVLDSVSSEDLGSSFRDQSSNDDLNDLPPLDLPPTADDSLPLPADDNSSSSTTSASLQIDGTIVIPSQKIVIGKEFNISIRLKTNASFTAKAQARVFQEMGGQWKLIHQRDTEGPFASGTNTYSFMDVYGVAPVVQAKGKFLFALNIIEKTGRGTLAMSKAVDSTKSDNYIAENVEISSQILSPLPAKVNQEVLGRTTLTSDRAFNGIATSTISKGGKVIHTITHQVAIPVGTVSFSYREILGVEPIPTETGTYSLLMTLESDGQSGTLNRYSIEKVVTVQ